MRSMHTMHTKVQNAENQNYLNSILIIKWLKKFRKQSVKAQELLLYSDF